MSDYWRPIPLGDIAAVGGAYALAGGPVRFTHVEHLRRDAPPQVVAASTIPAGALQNLTAPRPPICNLTMDQPRLMGIINVTPDSFSDGGDHAAPEAAVAGAGAMTDADILDIGGESTRPGSDTVSAAAELARVEPVIAALRRAGRPTPVSIDTRKADVARAAVAAGASLVNDVSACAYDPAMADTVRDLDVPVCLMHASGDPKTMQQNPRYDDVLLDVYDYLAARVAYVESLGIRRSGIIVDPGIGFGKTRDHNLALLRRLSLFHGLGCAVLLGVSRKRFIGDIGAAPDAKDRFPGSCAVALDALRQGVQILRVHDVAQTAQAVRLFTALHPL